MAHGPEKRGKQDVSRVLFTTAGTDPAVGVIICLGPPLPAASSGAGGTERDDDQPLFRGPKPWPCSRPGFTEPAPLDAAGALLPHLCTLACASGGQRPPLPSAVCFCGTVLTVTRTGRYPAGLAIGEPGLSSTGRSPAAAETRRDLTDRDHLACFSWSMVRRVGEVSCAEVGCAGDREPNQGITRAIIRGRPGTVALSQCRPRRGICWHGLMSPMEESRPGSCRRVGPMRSRQSSAKEPEKILGIGGTADQARA